MKFVSTLHIFAGFILLFGAISAKADHGTLEHVDIHQFAELMEKAANDDTIHIIDVRTPGEFRKGHLAGAEVIDFYAPGFTNKIKQLDKSHTYLLYCRSANRSGKTLNLMGRMGFDSVYNMKGGIKAWNKANYPIVK